MLPALHKRLSRTGAYFEQSDNNIPKGNALYLFILVESGPYLHSWPHRLAWN